jgi:hypothetical protein
MVRVFSREAVTPGSKKRMRHTNRLSSRPTGWLWSLLTHGRTSADARGPRGSRPSATARPQLPNVVDVPLACTTEYPLPSEARIKPITFAIPEPPIEPWKGASPNAKIPPSLATSQ